MADSMNELLQKHPPLTPWAKVRVRTITKEQAAVVKKALTTLQKEQKRLGSIANKLSKVDANLANMTTDVQTTVLNVMSDLAEMLSKAG